MPAQPTEAAAPPPPLTLSGLLRHLPEAERKRRDRREASTPGDLGRVSIPGNPVRGIHIGAGEPGPNLEDNLSTATLGSILLGSHDPQRLRSWYCAAFDCTPTDIGFLPFGETHVLIDARDDVGPENREPGRVILNFHVDDARHTAARLDELGVSWLVPVEERSSGLFGTLLDPDGNYIQIIQLSPEYLAAGQAQTSSEPS